MEKFKTFQYAIIQFIHMCTYRDEIDYPQMIYCHKSKRFYIGEYITTKRHETIICEYNQDDGIDFFVNDQYLIDLLTKNKSK